jgi:hypothetical protein
MRTKDQRGQGRHRIDATVLAHLRRLLAGAAAIKMLSGAWAGQDGAETWAAHAEREYHAYSYETLRTS